MAAGKHLGASRQEVYEVFINLPIGFGPLSKHTNDWFNTRQPSGDTSVDIFGPPHAVEAIEATFLLREDIGVAQVVARMVQIGLVEDWRDGLAWWEKAMEELLPSNKKIQEKLGDVYLTLYLLKSTGFVMFSVDTVRQ